MRPVFNCTYKQKKIQSLNEAAYPRVNLMGDMLELLIHIRANKYVLLADIRKAFLIHLALEKDQNCLFFGVFFKKGENCIITNIQISYSASRQSPLYLIIY